MVACLVPCDVSDLTYVQKVIVCFTFEARIPLEQVQLLLSTNWLICVIYSGVCPDELNNAVATMLQPTATRFKF